MGTKNCILYRAYNQAVGVTNARVRRWGSSLGVVLPKEVVRTEGLREGDEVALQVKKALTVQQAFGTLRGWRVNAQKLKDELREGW